MCPSGRAAFLDDSDTAQFARARLLGCSLPDEADLDGGLRLASEISASKAEGLYKQIKIKEARFRIIRARKALDRVLFSQFDIESNPEAARRAIIDAGVLADAVLALAQDKSNRFDKLLRTYADAPALAVVIKKPANLIHQFATLLNEPHVGLGEDWARIASVLRENNQWYPTDGGLIGLQEVRRLITAVWNTEVDRFPDEMRGTLLKTMGRGAERLGRFIKRATGSDLV